MNPFLVSGENSTIGLCFLSTWSAYEATDDSKWVLERVYGVHTGQAGRGFFLFFFIYCLVFIS